MKHSVKALIAVFLAAALVFALCACGAKAEEEPTAPGTFVFQAENALITDGSGNWPPITEAGLDVTTDKPSYCPGISNIGDGSALSWIITSDQAAGATITLRVASHLKDWGNEADGTIGVDDVSTALELTVNGEVVPISGSLPGGAVLPPLTSGGTAYKIVSITVPVELKEGENDITFTTLGTMETVNLFMDKLIVETDANLTWTETDNSARVWGG